MSGRNINIPFHSLNFKFVSITCLLNEKVEFKRPATRYRKNSISCGVLYSVDFRCRVELRPLGVARGIKGKGPRLTFEPLRLLSEFRRKQKMSELNKYTTRTLETHIYTIADIVTLL